MGKRIYWNLGTKVEIEGLQEHDGCVVESNQYSRYSLSSGVILEILRDDDFKLSKITINDFLDNRSILERIEYLSKDRAPSALADLYKEFLVMGHKDLEGAMVTGLYSEYDVLLGISKRVSEGY